MENSDKMKKAIKAVIKDLREMSAEELIAELEQSRIEMDEALIKGEFHWGYSIWYAQEPEEAEAYRQELFKKHGKLP